MGRYHGTLHKLIDSASTSNSKTKWNQVLHYLEGHTLPDNSATNPNFESPLPPYSAASTELEAELFDQQGSKKEDTPLRIAVKTAPAALIAALCHLGPEVAKLADSRNRLPIHWACHRNPNDAETEKVFLILIRAAPETLLHRDDGGRTPLHWLFWYHAPSRSATLVRMLCQQLPVQNFRDIRQPRDSQNERYPLPDIPIPDDDSIPAVAAVIPDSRHGAIPLHYAVMQGASKDALKALINEYPNSLAYGDRKGRTALAWYFGAGHLLDENKRHVCGETNDPNAIPWWNVNLMTSTIQTLVSSKVARKIDDIGRTPLHWACHLYARSMSSQGKATVPLKGVQCLVDNNIDAVVTRDLEGRTPLHLLFAIVAQHQAEEQQRLVMNGIVRDNINLNMGGPPAFSPEKGLIQLLLKQPDVDVQDQFRFDGGRDDRKPASASCVEDISGLLPLHLALKVATEPEIIQLLIQSNPTGLIHASEDELQTPLVHAFESQYSAPLQSSKTFELMMAAYVTSRHGTFIDGRVSLKMEDTRGNYPLHYACMNEASVDIIQMFVDKFPHCAVHENADGDLPLHCLLSPDSLFSPSSTKIIYGATLSKGNIGLQTEKESVWQKKVEESYMQKMKILLKPLMKEKYLKIASSAHGMTPLHIALAFRAARYTDIYKMIDIYPNAGAAIACQNGSEFSCIALHENAKEGSQDVDEWNAIREMLFAFNPLAGNYRKDPEILDACVNLIRNEITGKGSYHLSELNNSLPECATLELKETLSSLKMPEIDVAYRFKSRKNKHGTPNKSKKVSRQNMTAAMKLKKAFSSEGETKVEKSIYDEDFEDRYVVSPASSMDHDDEDDDEFLSSQDEDEYYSDDESSESESEDATSFARSTKGSSWEQSVSTGTTSNNLSDAVGSPASAASQESSKLSQGKQSVRSGQDKREAIVTSEGESSEKNGGIAPEDIVLSDVALRLWCFFLLYNDPKHPEDNYLKQVYAITEELDFDVLQRLLSWPVPHYAEPYLEEGTSLQGITLGDVASPTSKVLFKSFQYFLGKFEFSSDVDGVILHKSSDGNTICVRAIEHTMFTKEYLPKQEYLPGEIEEAIWETGEQLEEKGGYEASKFVDKKRFVCFKLTKNQEAFENEVQCRKRLGLNHVGETLGNVQPLLGCYNALSEDKSGRRYVMDVHDERFRTLSVVGSQSIRLSDFTYALVYPYSEEGDLYDYFYHHGVDNACDASEIGRQVASALNFLHKKGVTHGNLSMRHITMIPMGEESKDRSWVVSDLSTATMAENERSFNGSISHNGSAQFQTGILPPEMFVKLTAAEARVYQTYWEMVERVHDVRVDKNVIKPFVNIETGATFVLRCHFNSSKIKDSDVKLPDLPYQLVAARESTDLWCFGLLIFTLCSGGRPLFPSNIKTGHLLNYESIVGWSSEKAADIIYEHVVDPIAQDLLLLLLSPFETRAQLSMETILSHPFFHREESSKAIGSIIDKRENESAAFIRKKRKMVNEKSDDNWLASRSVTVACWNFDLLRKFSFSSNEIVSRILGIKNISLPMPCNLILLPYKLSAKNKRGKLAPTTKKDVEHAEQMGIFLLSLGKVCCFAHKMRSVIEESKQKKWTASSLLDAVNLPGEEFQSIKILFSKIAAAHVEAFRDDPMSSVLKLVERRVADIRKVFKDAGKAFLYLVDEHAGVPLVGAPYAPYPLEVSSAMVDKFLIRALPFMHISILYARGVANGVAGLVRLIFEAAYPHVPPSWSQAASGLTHKLDEDAIMGEVGVLQDALGRLYSTKTSSSSLDDNLHFMKDSCLKVDTLGTFGDMQRVVTSGYALWTTKEGAAEIQESCSTFGIKDALGIQDSLERRLKAQEEQIKILSRDIEHLRFRKDLNLEIPDNSSPPRQTSNNARSLGDRSSPKFPKPSPSAPRLQHTLRSNDVSDEKKESDSLKTSGNDGIEPKKAICLSQDKGSIDQPTRVAIEGDGVSPVETEKQFGKRASIKKTESHTESSSPVAVLTEDQFYDSKEAQSLEVPSFDESKGPSKCTEERDATVEDVSTNKLGGESLREVISLD